MTTRTVVRSRFPRLSANFRRYAGSAGRASSQAGRGHDRNHATQKAAPRLDGFFTGIVHGAFLGS